MLALALSLTAVGCKKKQAGNSVIPGQEFGKSGAIENPQPTGERPMIIPSGNPIGNPIAAAPTANENLTPVTMTDTNGGLTQPTNDWTLRAQDRDRLKAFTVYFDFDRAVVRKDQTAKIDAVVAQFKSGAPAEDLLIEGHCDERGTEEYNRTLGERRALALREMLSALGVNAGKIYTVTYGKSKPAIDGHNEEAWSKNRRGEFIILLPNKK